MYRSQRAVTVMELMITVAILSILAAIAVPTWRTTMAYGRRAAALNDLRAGLAYAREYAVTRGRTVALCTSRSRERCDKGDWNEGWIVYVDLDRDYERDPGEPVLKVHGALDGSDHLSGNRLIAHHVGFQRDGMMHGVHNGTITYSATPPRPALRRCLVVARSGRIRAANGTHCH